MEITVTHTDEVVLRELGVRLTQLRLERNLTQAAVAREAGVGKITVERLEAGRPAELRTLIRVLRVLGLLEGLNQLLPEPLPSPIDALRRRGGARRRASGARRSRDSAPRGEGQWHWGDRAESAVP